MIPMIPKKYLEKEKEGKQQCQNCLEFGHWTYECTRPQTYVYRPSRTKLFKQNKFNLFEIKEEKKEENSEKDKKNNSRSNSKSSNSSRNRNRSYSSGSSPNSKASRSYSSSSSSSSFSRSGHSENSNFERRNEIIQNKKRQKLNEMLDNIQKHDENKKNKNKNKSRSHSHHRKRDRKRRSRSRSRRRERSRDRNRDRRKNSDEQINKKKDNYNDFFKRDYNLKKNERWKKIEEIEMENALRSKSPSYGRKGAFRKRPYE